LKARKQKMGVPMYTPLHTLHSH